MRETGIIKATLGLTVGGLMLAAGLQPAPAGQNQTDPATTAAASTQTGQFNNKDYNFLVQAARIDLDELQAGELAQKQGASQAVRQFAQHMINDHSKVNTGLKEIAGPKGAALPTQLSQEQNTALQHLESLSGASFDQAYAQDMVKGHTQAVNEFRSAAKTLTDPDLRAWAETTLPLLQEHLRMAKNMQAAIKNEK